MDEIKLYRPIITGTPILPSGQAPGRTAEPQEAGESFQTVLKRQLQETSGVAFSKHAVKRTIDHQIELDEDSLNRLGEGVKLAEEKNLEDTLILVDRTAFLVNVKNRTVITTVDSSDMKGNVFTNIDGTVIV